MGRRVMLRTETKEQRLHVLTRTQPCCTHLSVSKAVRRRPLLHMYMTLWTFSLLAWDAPTLSLHVIPVQAPGDGAPITHRLHPSNTL